MEQITIDGDTYDVQHLSEEAKAQIAALRATDQRIAENQQELAILQTARNAYAAALRALLPDIDDSEEYEIS